MNLIETIIAIILIILVIVTFIAEPKISIQYGKAVVKSSVKVFSWGKEQIHNITEKEVDDNGAGV